MLPRIQRDLILITLYELRDFFLLCSLSLGSATGNSIMGFFRHMDPEIPFCVYLSLVRFGDRQRLVGRRQ